MVITTKLSETTTSETLINCVNSVVPDMPEIACGAGVTKDGQIVPIAEGMSCTDAPDILCNGIIIRACNEGATQVGVGPDSYGSYFQRGNNYGHI